MRNTDPRIERNRSEGLPFVPDPFPAAGAGFLDASRREAFA